MRRKKMKFDVVVPTYQRVEKLEKFLSSVKKQNNPNFHVYCYFDNNDSNGYEKFKDSDGVTCFLLHDRKRAFGVWNHHLKTMDADGLLYVCDDIEFYDGCFEEIEKIFMRDGLIGFNQANIPSGEGFSRFAMGCIGAGFADLFPNRQCFCPDFLSFHADSELGQVAIRKNKFIYGENCKIHHHHPAHEKKEWDDTHNVVRDSVPYDRETYNLRRAKDILWGLSFERVR